MDIGIEDLDNSIENDDEDIQLTSAELIEMMEEIWVNEKFAPELLPQKSEIVDCVLGQIKYMEENLNTLQNTDFKKGIHQLEVDRIRFLVTSYLRNRVEKIESYVFHLLKQEEERAQKKEKLCLSEAELQFALSFKQGIEQHFENVTGSYTGLPVDDWKSQPITPNLYSFIFLKAKNQVDGVVINVGQETDDGDVVDLSPGSQMIISYNSIANLLKNSDVKLI